MLAVLLVPSFALAANYFISSEADMIEFANSVNGGDHHYGDTYELTANITLSGNWTPISWFYGTFDGKGYQIEYTTSNFIETGLFCFIDSNGTVKNLRVKASVSGFIVAGGITARNYGYIENCSFEGSVACTIYAGGLAGANYGTISNCFNKGTVSASYAGGLASYAYNSTVTNCYNAGTVNGPYNGGMLGEAYYSTIHHSFWLDTSCGAVIGYNEGSTIQNAEHFDSSGNLYAPVLGQATLLDALNDHTDIWAIYDTGYNYPVFKTIAASPLSLDFGSAETGYDVPAMQTVTIENAGEHPLTINVHAASSHFAYGTLSSDILAAGASVPLTVQPKAGLLPGTYGDTLTISDSEGRTANVTVSFTVNTATLTAASVGGIEAPQTGAVPIAEGSLTSGDARYILTGLTFKNGDGSPATLVNGRFKAGTSYQAVIELTAAAGCKFPSGGITPSVNAGTPQAGTVTGGDAEENSLTFLVTFPDTANTYEITATPASLAFDSLAEGYIQPEAITITVTNTGSQSIALYQPTSAHYTIGTLSETALAPYDTATFTIVPKPGLSVGTYNETVYLLGSMGVHAQVEVTFACTVPIDDYEVTSGDGGTYQQNGSGPSTLSFTANGNINQFTGLTINGQLVDEDDYDVYEGSTIVVLHQDFLATLLPGTYTLRFHYTDGHTQANFVVQDTMPVTGDNNALYIFGTLMALCLLALWLIKRKKATRK